MENYGNGSEPGSWAPALLLSTHAIVLKVLAKSRMRAPRCSINQIVI
jgi:hypothetical protein